MRPCSTPRYALLLAFGALTAAGCGGSSGPGRSLFTGGGLVDTAHTPIYDVQPGTGIDQVLLGRDAGYFITANTRGSFRIVWTGDVNSTAMYRHFYGSVWTTGSFSSVIIGCTAGFCPLEADSYVSTVHPVAGGNRVDWDTFATSGLSGFDFMVDAVPAYFDFFIDGARHPELVLFPATANGGAASNVAQVPFGLTPR
jgi:hypothetical protein